MNNRNPDAWYAVFGVLLLIAVTVAGVGLFLGLAAHPYVAAGWALLSTAAAVWLGGVCLGHRQDEQLRALADEHRQATLERPERQTVADMIDSRRLGHRIGDAERDVVVAALHTHFAAGRLTPAELDERLTAALAAREVIDLIVVVRDLPSEETGR